MIKLNKNNNYSFKIEVNHGNDLLNDSKMFNTIEDFKSYVNGLTYEMKKIRTVKTTDLTNHETITKKLDLRSVETKSKTILCREF